MTFGRLVWLSGLIPLVLPAAASGQLFARPDSVVDARSAAARAAGAAILVDGELVRSGPPRLELQAADGRILVAERSVFEDRGDGAAMWAGRFPGADWDSVVLTVQDGYVQGMFGEPGRAAHWIRAGPDGAGRLDQPVARGSRDGVAFCAGGVAPSPPDPAAFGARRLATPAAGASSRDRLDILVLYTVSAADAWETFGYGTPRASVQAAMDFLNLVFRNHSMPAAARLVHLAEAPASLEGAVGVLGRLWQLREVADLQEAHQADLVHLFIGEEESRRLGYCGQAYTLTRAGERDERPAAHGWTAATCGIPAREGAYPYFGQVFAHEIGHNLGANHDPAHTDRRPDVAVRPWAFGHIDINVFPTVETIMSYRSYVPRQWVPSFSSTRIRPNGWTIGVPDERDNERALVDTFPLALRYSELLPDPSRFGDPFGGWGPYAPADLTASPTSSTSVRLAWEDRSDNESGFRIHARLAGGMWRTALTVAADESAAEVVGLKRGGRYAFRVRSWNDEGGGRDSDIVEVLLPSSDDPGPDDPGPDDPGPDDPGPEGIDGPDDITAAAVGATSVELGWSGVASGMVEVEVRTWKDGWRRLAVADGAAGRVTLEGLDADAPHTFRLRRRSGGERVSAWSEEISVTTGGASGPCRSGGRYLCLAGGRFEVQTHWKDHNRAGVHGTGTAAPIEVSDESGMFWFFTRANIELVVKTLDGRGVNGHWWVFFGALSDVEYWVTVRDTSAGGQRTWYNPPKEICGQSDTTAFASSAASGSAARSRKARRGVGSEETEGFDLVPMTVRSVAPASVAPARDEGGCEPGGTRLCLRGGRFSVEVEFLDPNSGERKAAAVVSSLTTAETGFFWFFSPTNVEVAAKVLDGRSLTGKHWFLYGGLSDVEYAITLTDTATGELKRYVNEAGSLCGGIDTEAL